MSSIELDAVSVQLQKPYPDLAWVLSSSSRHLLDMRRGCFGLFLRLLAVGGTHDVYQTFYWGFPECIGTLRMQGSNGEGWMEKDWVSS